MAAAANTVSEVTLHLGILILSQIHIVLHSLFSVQSCCGETCIPVELGRVNTVLSHHCLDHSPRSGCLGARSHNLQIKYYLVTAMASFSSTRLRSPGEGKAHLILLWDSALNECHA